jgi:hypothetical protein
MQSRLYKKADGYRDPPLQFTVTFPVVFTVGFTAANTEVRPYNSKSCGISRVHCPRLVRVHHYGLHLHPLQDGQSRR